LRTFRPAASTCSRKSPCSRTCPRSFVSPPFDGISWRRPFWKSHCIACTGAPASGSPNGFVAVTTMTPPRWSAKSM
jgi:hypothetical protein